jgi:hypothetical protein
MGRKTHCRRGHPFTAENIYLHQKTGARHCRACNVENRKKQRRGKKVALLTTNAPAVLRASTPHANGLRGDARYHVDKRNQLCLVDQCYSLAESEKLCAHHLAHRDDRTDPHSDFIAPLSRARLMGSRA